jgi:hypothetical protein
LFVEPQLHFQSPDQVTTTVVALVDTATARGAIFGDALPLGC